MGTHFMTFFRFYDFFCFPSHDHRAEGLFAGGSGGAAAPPGKTLLAKPLLPLSEKNWPVESHLGKINKPTVWAESARGPIC